MEDGCRKAIGLPTDDEQREAGGDGTEVRRTGGHALHEDGGGDADGGNRRDDKECEERGEHDAHEYGLERRRSAKRWARRRDGSAGRRRVT